MYSLDEFDRRIIALLEKDGRLSNVEIARSLNLSEGTIRKRLDRLLSAGIMRVIAVTDPAAVGLPATIIMGIQAELGRLNEIAQRLAALPEVRCVDIVTGTYDVMIEAALPSGEHLLSFLIDKVSAIPGVRRTETSHVMQMVKRACDWSITELPDKHAVQASRAASPVDQIVPGTIVIPH